MSAADLETGCVSMIAKLFNAPADADANTIGTSTIGSSEAIMVSTHTINETEGIWTDCI